MVAANIPARIKPTSTGGNNCSAMVGRASSASKFPSSGRYKRDNIPTRVAML
ncbi:hypothetical protein D3C83_176980 [compost metagenome]